MGGVHGQVSLFVVVVQHVPTAQFVQAVLCAVQLQGEQDVPLVFAQAPMHLLMQQLPRLLGLSSAS